MASSSPSLRLPDDPFELLPDAVLATILSLVNPYHVRRARCAPVSRRWNRLSRECGGVLHLDCSFVLPRGELYYSEWISLLEARVGQLVADNARSGLKHLTLCGPDFSYGPLASWLGSLASTLESVELSVCLSAPFLQRRPPDASFWHALCRCHKLKHLSLRNLVLTASPYLLSGPPAFGPGLVSCRLMQVDMSDGDLTLLLKLLPGLANLEIVMCDGLKSPTVSNCGLRSLAVEFLDEDDYLGDAVFVGLEELGVSCPSLEILSLSCVDRVRGTLPCLKEVVLLSPSCLIDELAEVHHLVFKSSPVFWRTVFWKPAEVLQMMSMVDKLKVATLSVVPRMEKCTEQRLSVPDFFQSIDNSSCRALQIGPDIVEALGEYAQEFPMYSSFSCLSISRLSIFLYVVDERCIRLLSLIAKGCLLLERVDCYVKGEVECPFTAVPGLEHAVVNWKQVKAFPW